jgi:soluble lytic murein transglycosylase-like protein
VDFALQIGTESTSEWSARATWESYFMESSEHYKIPVSWPLAIARKETAFRNIRSAPGASDDRRGGSWGPMQVSSKTAEGLGYLPGASLEARGQWMLADIARGIDIGCRLLHVLREDLGDDFAKIAAAYNAGEGAVRRGFADHKYADQAVAFQEEYAPLDADTP